METLADAQDTDLAELYPRYVTFMNDLMNSQPHEETEQGSSGLAGQTRTSRRRTFEEFCAWWPTLDPGTRKLLSRDYEAGYAETIRQSIERLQAIHQQAREAARNAITET